MKFSLYSKKNRLDEMQEQTMRKIESHGFWLLWYSLLAAWIVQTVFGAVDKAAGEWVVFMIGCIYMVVACLRNGLWERHFSDTPPANAVYSLVAAVAVTLIIGFSRGYWVGAAFAGVFALHCCSCASLWYANGASIWMTRRTENNIIKRGCCTAFDAAAPFCMGA